MISTDKNFLFIHVPKTGGNSIQNVLIEYSGDTKINNQNKLNSREHFGLNIAGYPELHKHSTLESYFYNLDRNLYDSLYKFSVIRNPWDWCISWYFHRNKQDWDRYNFEYFIKQAPTFFDYFSIRNKRSQLLSKVLRKIPSPLSVSMPGITDELDYIIRFENLSEDFNKVASILEIDGLSLPHVNKSTHKPYYKYYDEYLVELVRKKFFREIEFGGYTFT